ncbi:MAG: hypothetical protein HYS27_03690 [Deltaproteobacteria bacterium]|nr:hypothetical protein [Deltaproteobacteria bacterium]
MDLTSFALGALASAVGCSVALRVVIGGKRARFLEHATFQVAAHDAVLDAIAIIRPFGEIAGMIERALVLDTAVPDADVVARLAPLLRKAMVPEDHLKYLTAHAVATCRHRLAAAAKDVGETPLFTALGAPLYLGPTITVSAEVEAFSQGIIETLRREPFRAINYSVARAAAELSWPFQDAEPNLFALTIRAWRPMYFASRLRPFQELLDERPKHLRELLERVGNKGLTPPAGPESAAGTAALGRGGQ